MSLLTRVEKLEEVLCPDPDDRITVTIDSFAEGEVSYIRYGDSTIERRQYEDEESFLSRAKNGAWASADSTLKLLVLRIEKGQYGQSLT